MFSALLNSISLETLRGTDVDPMLLTCDEDGQWTKYPKLDQDCFKILKLIKEDNMKIPAVVAEMKPVLNQQCIEK